MGGCVHYLQISTFINKNKDVQISPGKVSFFTWEYEIRALGHEKTIKVSCAHLFGFSDFQIWFKTPIF